MMCLWWRQRRCRHSGCHMWGHMRCWHRWFGPRRCLLHLDPLLGELGPVHLFMRHVLIHGGMNRPLIPRSSGSGPHDFYLQQFFTLGRLAATRVALQYCSTPPLPKQQCFTI